MSLFHEIRKQSRTTRELMFGLCVLTTVAVVGALWVHSFQQDMYALLNPDQTIEQRFYAQSTTQPSAVGKSFDSLRAGIYGLLHLNQTAEVKTTVDSTKNPVYVLPLANDRYR